MENSKKKEEVYEIINSAVRRSDSVEENILIPKISNILVNRYDDNLEEKLLELEIERTSQMSSWIKSYIKEKYPDEIDGSENLKKEVKSIFKKIIEENDTWDEDVIYNEIEDYLKTFPIENRKYKRLSLGFNNRDRIIKLLHLYAYEMDKMASAKNVYSFLL